MNGSYSVRYSRDKLQPVKAASLYALHIAFVVAWLSAIVLAMAIVMPFLTLTVSVDNPLAEAIYELIKAVKFTPYTKTLLGGIVNLFHNGNWRIGSVLLGFSVVFPVCKLVLLIGTIVDMLATTSLAKHFRGEPKNRFWERTPMRSARLFGSRLRHMARHSAVIVPKPVRRASTALISIASASVPRSRLGWLELLGPWSMLDVFFVAVLVLMATELPHGVSLDVRSGFWLFFASVVGAMLASMLTTFAVRELSVVVVDPLDTSGEHLLQNRSVQLQTDLSILCIITRCHSWFEVDTQHLALHQSSICLLESDHRQFVTARDESLHKNTAPTVSCQRSQRSGTLLAAAITLVAGASLRVVAAFAPERTQVFPTPNLLGKGLTWRIYELGPADWGIAAENYGAILLAFSTGLLAMHYFLRYPMSCKESHSKAESKSPNPPPKSNAVHNN